MLNNYGADAATFLIKTVSDLFLMLVMLRLLLQLVRADFYNPVCQFIVKATNWAIIPLRRIIPGIKGLDLASIVVLLFIQSLALFLAGISRGVQLSLPSTLVLSCAELLSLLISVYFITIFAQIILSWLGPGTYNPVTTLLYSLNQPVLRPAQRLIRPIAGIDISPMLVLILFQLVKILLIAPLTDLGLSLR